MKNKRIEEKFQEETKKIEEQKIHSKEYDSKDPLYKFQRIWEEKLSELSDKINKSTDLKRFGDAVTQYANFRIKMNDKLLDNTNTKLETYEGFAELEEDNHDVSSDSGI